MRGYCCSRENRVFTNGNAIINYTASKRAFSGVLFRTTQSPSTNLFLSIAFIIKRKDYQNDSSWTVLSQRQFIVI